MIEPATIIDPIPDLFLGEWTVLAKKKKDRGSDSAAEIRSIKITRIRLSEDEPYIVELLGQPSLADGGTEAPTLHSYECSLEKESETLCYTDPKRKESGCISYWRNQAYDTIFALQEDNESGEMTRIWTARRKPCRTSSSSEIFLKEVVSNLWEVSLTKGFHGAKAGYIRIRSFDETSSPTDDAAGSVNTRFAASGLYGLYHSQAKTGSPFVLYDVMAYDNRVKSFNSVFGVRSLNYWNRTDRDGESKRIFATFNNKFSIPATHFLRHDSDDGIQNRLGSLMPFEKDQLSQKLLELLEELDSFLQEPDKFDRSSDLGKIHELVAKLKHVESENNDSDDPDIGIWVGVPTTPPTVGVPTTPPTGP